MRSFHLFVSIVIIFSCWSTQAQETRQKKATSPSKAFVKKGDLIDAQQAFAELSDSKVNSALTVEVQPRKERPEFDLSATPVTTWEKLDKLLQQREVDPLPAFVKAGMQDDYLIMPIAIWDAQKKPGILKKIREASTAEKTLRATAELYGIGAGVSLEEITDAIGWKQLEQRGVKVIHPPLKPVP